MTTAESRLIAGQDLTTAGFNDLADVWADNRRVERFSAYRIRDSFTEASALDLANNEKVMVTVLDTGTHTASIGDVGAVSNQTPNSGYFYYNSGMNKLIRIAPLESEIAQRWAEGTLPGGNGTKSAKEWSEEARDIADEVLAINPGTLAEIQAVRDDIVESTTLVTTQADRAEEAKTAAELARDQAADLVLPENIFVDVSLSTAEAAVTTDTNFKLVNSTTGLADVRVRTGGGSTLLYTEVTAAALASTDTGKGAGLIRYEGGGNLQNIAEGNMPLSQSGTYTAGTIGHRFKRFICVTDAPYNAVAGNSTDQSAAFGAALDSIIAAGGGVLYVPSGVYRLTSQITKTLSADQSITIVGSGRANTVLDFSTATTLGLQFTSTSTTPNRKPQIEVRNMSITTSRKNSGTAIRVSYANDQNFLPSVTIENVYIGGTLTRISDSGADFGYWTTHVHLTDARNSRIMNFEFSGEINVSPNSDISILLDGECTATQLIDGLIIEGGAYGLLATGTTEGVSVINCDILYCRYGVRSNTAGEPQFTMVGGSVNCSEVNVWLTNALHSVISGTLMYAAGELNPGGPWPEWRGVLVDGVNSRHNKIIGCTFSKNAPRIGDICTGIDFAQGRDCVASGNTYEGLGPSNQLSFGVQVRSGFARATIGDDNVFDNVATRVNIDAGAVASHHQQLIKSGSTGPITTGATITFPQEFPNICTSVIAGHSGTNTAISVTTTSKTKSSFSINFSGGGTAVFDWIATGE